MKDEWIFAAAPYAALLLLPIVCGWRITRGHDGLASAAASRPPGWGRRDPAAICGWIALAAIAAGHGVLLFAPALVIGWNQSTGRLLVLEGTALCLAVISLIGIALGSRRGRASRERTTADVVLRTLVLTEIASGIAVAVLYRWGTSWAAVTVAPYAASLFRLSPRVPLVAATPFLVRLHVFCAFAIVGVTPFSSIALRVVVPARRALSSAAAALAGWQYGLAGAVVAMTRRSTEALSLSVEEES